MSSEGVPLLAVAVPVAIVVGLFVGSFLNVVIYRAPLGLSVAKPRSFCPTCRRQLEWWENIPVVSWVILRGRCHTGHEPISARYPLVELSTGVVFGLVTWGWHGTVVSAGYCALAAGMVAVGLIELNGQRSPLAVAAIATALGQSVIVIGAGWQHHWRIVGGSLTGTAVALVVYSLLRILDPHCQDPRAHGRSALLIAGCWMGGLGWAPIALGAALWIVVYFFCMMGARSMARQPAMTTRSMARQPATTAPVPAPARAAHPLVTTPLVSALAMALVASLIAGG